MQQWNLIFERILSTCLGMHPNLDNSSPESITVKRKTQAVLLFRLFFR
jgi:hypothetical protein